VRSRAGPERRCRQAGTYRIDGGASQPIPGTVSTDARPTEVHVVESRSELIPNP
jgi:hypothetical protein